MVILRAIYPNTPGKKFDMEYFLQKHMIMARELMGDACLDMQAEEGVSFGYNSPFIAIGSFFFDSPDSLMQSVVPVAEKLALDLLNFTDITPHIQASYDRIGFNRNRA
jgi:uncharacterized protein (TIGR02118 family)